MPNPGIAIGAGSIGSALIGGSAARSAARTSANAQERSAELAARESRFRPVGLRTRFGESNFGYEIPGEAPPTEPVKTPEETDEEFEARVALFPEQVADYERRARTEGVATEFGYTPSAELEQIQGMLGPMYQRGLGEVADLEAAAPYGKAAAARLFGLGGQILPTEYDPTAAAQRYYQEQQAMLDPTRQREESRLASSLFGRGRGGLSISGMGQPELYSLTESRRAQDLALASQARERARGELREDIGLGQGLFGSGMNTLGDIYGLYSKAYSPFLTGFGAARSVEEAAMEPLRLSAELGGRSATAGATAGDALLRGGMGAASTRLQGSLVMPTMLSGATNSLLSNPYFMKNMMNPAVGSTYSPYKVSTVGPSGLEYDAMLASQNAGFEY
jgi:hypothetical protein